MKYRNIDNIYKSAKRLRKKSIDMGFKLGVKVRINRLIVPLKAK